MFWISQVEPVSMQAKVHIPNEIHRDHGINKFGVLYDRK